MTTCIHTKPDGIQCGSPAIKGNTRCYYHRHQLQRKWRTPADLPPITTPRDRLLLINEIMHGLVGRRIDPELGRSLLYALQVQST